MNKYINMINKNLSFRRDSARRRSLCRFRSFKDRMWLSISD